MLIWLGIGVIVCGTSISADPLKPIRFFSYHSDEPGCRANPSTDLELTVSNEGTRWVIVAPPRVVATDSERRRAKGPLDIEVAEPLETILRNRLADSQNKGRNKDGRLNITRIKIVTVAHDVVGLGMAKAQAHIRLEFRICVKGDTPETDVVKVVARNGPDMSTLWHQPRGDELRSGFRKAADEALTAIVEYALRFPE